MLEKDAVFLLYLPLTFSLYAVFSTRHLSKASGREPPPWLARLVGSSAPPASTFRAALRSYLGWTAFTQFAPVAVALSDATGYVRLASALEVLAAVAWTGYLRFRPAS